MKPFGLGSNKRTEPSAPSGCWWPTCLQHQSKRTGGVAEKGRGGGRGENMWETAMINVLSEMEWVRESRTRAPVRCGERAASVRQWNWSEPVWLKSFYRNYSCKSQWCLHMRWFLSSPDKNFTHWGTNVSSPLTLLVGTMIYNISGTQVGLSDKSGGTPSLVSSSSFILLIPEDRRHHSGPRSSHKGKARFS